MRMKTALRRLAREPSRGEFAILATDARVVAARTSAFRRADASGKPSAKRKALAWIAAQCPKLEIREVAGKIHRRASRPELN